MNQDKYVFTQITDFLNRSKFNRIVAKYNVKEVPLAWQQLQFFAIYCYLTGSPHDKGN